MIADDVVHLSILLGEGNAEVALKHIAEENEVLLGNGFIQSVFTFEVGAYLRRYGFVVHERIAGDLIPASSRFTVYINICWDFSS